MASYARGMRKIFGHRLIGIFGLFFAGKVAVGATDFDVLFLVVRKAAAAGPVF